MTFELVVCGSSGTHPGPGRNCSGYLLRTPGAKVMVDCGNGSTSVLQQEVAFEELDAVVITHRHHDHWADLVGLYYALRFHPDGPREIDVHAPAGTRDFVAQLLSDDAAAIFEQVCRFHDATPGGHVTIGDLDLTFADSEHVVPTVAVRAEHGGAVLAYSSDSSGGPALVEIARGADLFLCEASWLGHPDEWPQGVHLTARGAGEHGRIAEVDHLLLTHMWPTNDRDRALDEAREAYGDGPLDLAEDGQIWQVGR